MCLNTFYSQWRTTCGSLQLDQELAAWSQLVEQLNLLATTLCHHLSRSFVMLNIRPGTRTSVFNLKLQQLTCFRRVLGSSFSFSLSHGSSLPVLSQFCLLLSNSFDCPPCKSLKYLFYQTDDQLSHLHSPFSLFRDTYTTHHQIIDLSLTSLQFLVLILGKFQLPPSVVLQEHHFKIGNTIVYV